VYAGSALDRLAAVSIGTNPHFDGVERRVEAHLLDFDADLYGRRLVVEIWTPIREQRRFDSLEELVAAIGDDVERTREAVRPA
jgi:riboflavin kinase/FMN adenylyltransferase